MRHPTVSEILIDEQSPAKEASEVVRCSVNGEGMVFPGDNKLEAAVAIVVSRSKEVDFNKCAERNELVNGDAQGQLRT